MFDWRSKFTESNFSWSEMEKTHVFETLASKLEELNHTETAWGWSPSKKVLASTARLDVSVPLRVQYLPSVTYVDWFPEGSGPPEIWFVPRPVAPSTRTWTPVVWGLLKRDLKVVSTEWSPAGGSSS